MPYKDPAKRRANDRKNAERRRALERERYATDAEYREARKRSSKAAYHRNPEANKARVAAYREGRKIAVFRTYLKGRYGITLEEWYALLISQSGRCAICVTPMADPHVDHCHASGAVRGLLCTNCNTGLGKFRDDPAILAAAIAYLQ